MYFYQRVNIVSLSLYQTHHIIICYYIPLILRNKTECFKMAVARVAFKVRIQAYWRIRPEPISDFGSMHETTWMGSSASVSMKTTWNRSLDPKSSKLTTLHSIFAQYLSLFLTHFPVTSTSNACARALYADFFSSDAILLLASTCRKIGLRDRRDKRDWWILWIR